MVDNAASRGAHAGGGAGGSAQTGAGAGGGEAPAAPGMSVDALENMMRDPSMQKLIYPYLPEGMRNPQTFEWMLKNPATRQQARGGRGEGTSAAGESEGGREGVRFVLWRPHSPHSCSRSRLLLASWRRC